ncbi:hypothetical protein GGS20DRAFT_597415 [Poronia punctata]|nr:hypothetical protein GGS20DRAFT_597415 [Poronia punctata]
MTWPSSLVFGSLLLGGVSSTVLPKRAFTPTVKTVTLLGNLADPAINRDSCGSVRVGDRAFWTCRDSQPYDDSGKPTLPLWSSSASWSNFPDGKPDLLMYGGDGSRTPFFPYVEGECNDNSAGACPDGSRYALWPDSPPLLTSNVNNVVTMYTWITKQQINPEVSDSPARTRRSILLLTMLAVSECVVANATFMGAYLRYKPTLVHCCTTCLVTVLLFSLSVNDPDPATSLYKMTYDLNNADRNALPTTTLVSEEFWPHASFPYGAYGSVVKDGIAYLFGKPSNGHVALAKVPVESVEDQSKYEFWVGGQWTSTLPALDDENVVIPNVSAGGQGTYYFSDLWNKWVWIGQAGISVSADFFITTADSITGPWEETVNFWSGETGTYFLGAYSLQAHPGLNAAGTTTNDIYVTYTKNDEYEDTARYSTPLIHIEWN